MARICVAMRLGGDEMDDVVNNPPGTVNEPQWIEIVDTTGNILNSRRLGPPID